MADEERLDQAELFGLGGWCRIGMGYLGAGKVAKLEFRSREELQRLTAETRP